jgi:hypothetical protein
MIAWLSTPPPQEVLVGGWHAGNGIAMPKT